MIIGGIKSIVVISMEAGVEYLLVESIILEIINVCVCVCVY